MAKEKREKLTRTKGPIYGVCGGIAKHCDINPLYVRFFFLILLIGTKFPIGCLYILTDMFLMEDPDVDSDG